MTTSRDSEKRHEDVIIVGAGLSGIGAACHLRMKCPGKSVAILEARPSIGGTWDLFRYPGVRSDSDMFTLGYEFRPWRGANAIAEGRSILEYLQATANEFDLGPQIQFNTKVISATWSTPEQSWTLHCEDVKTGSRSSRTCSFLYCNTGYYRYDTGYLPEFTDASKFEGEFIHPQFWPESVDLTGKRVVVIGSGATAITLVPAIACSAAHVTQLQRSPTYILAAPEKDRTADRLRRFLPPRVASRLARTKNIIMGSLTYQLCRRFPHFVKQQLTKGVAAQLPSGYDVESNFTPKYDPWDQRVCLDPNGSFFAAIRSGLVDVVTDTIDRFLPEGILLTSGKELPADVVVSATGLVLQTLGAITIDVDGTVLEPGSTMSYRGMMFNGVPNLAYTTGYTNASWTLKADLVARFVCRLITYMDDHELAVATPELLDSTMDLESSFNLQSGYIERGQDQIPRQGTRRPWKLAQNYPLDFLDLRFGRLTTEMHFEKRRSSRTSVRA